ncbi:MAG TPA: class I SAM-dependent methyltransferase [Gemmatimonadales bacterium]|jgi:hypothetical protein
MSVGLPEGLNVHLDAMTTLAATLEGHLTPREARFLSLLGSVPTARGDILEIGSFKGKSAILLAKSAAFAGANTRVAAVDPLTMPSETDPRDGDARTLPGILRENLRRHEVEGLVDFNQMTSSALAPSWQRPLRLLWIDGDHTWRGAAADFDAFVPFLRPGGIVALHDVLNRFDGPLRVVCERILSCETFGACGLVGSIGWAQVALDAASAQRWAATKESLRARLAALSPYVPPTQTASLGSRLAFKVLRWRVPHRALAAAEWARLVDRAPESQ